MAIQNPRRKNSLWEIILTGMIVFALVATFVCLYSEHSTISV